MIDINLLNPKYQVKNTISEENRKMQLSNDTKKYLALTTGATLALLGGFYLGRSTTPSVVPKKVEVLKVEGYEVVRQGPYLFGIDNDNNLRSVQTVEGKDPFALVTEKTFNMELNKTGESEKMNVSGLEVKLAPGTANSTVQIRKK